MSEITSTTYKTVEIHGYKIDYPDSRFRLNSFSLSNEDSAFAFEMKFMAINDDEIIVEVNLVKLNESLLSSVRFLNDIALTIQELFDIANSANSLVKLMKVEKVDEGV